MAQRIQNAGLMKLKLIGLLLCFFTAFNVMAEGENAEVAAKKFDAGKTIVEHISDSHEWHILGEIGRAHV